jgi:hypothetical protein
MPDSVISLLVQIPIVGAFIWFTLRLRDEERKERKERDQEWRSWLKDEHTAFMSFLTEERSTRAAQLDRSFVVLSSELTAINEKADARAAAAIEQVVSRLSESSVSSSSR